ncbi:arginine/serine-rich coiled-coil protein 2-like isoform X2 [Ylistrum balloti]|nr:arginine/serine-rich coiled-coil protein 2-like isoform X2 [Ylistrum balloti]
MIGGGKSPDTVSALGATAVDPASFLQSGIIAYPGLNKSRTMSFTESSGGDEPKSADFKLQPDAPNKMVFSFEEVQDNNVLPSEVARASRSRSRSSSASSRSSSRSSRSSSASSVERKKREKKVAQTATSRSSTSPKRVSKSKSRSPTLGRKRKSHSRSRSRSRSRSKGRKSRSHHSPGRRDRSSSRSRRHRHGRSRSRDRHRRHRRHGSKDRRSHSRDRNRRRKRRRSHSRDRKKRSSHHRRRSHSRSRGKRRRSKGRKSRSRSRSRDRHNRSRSRDRHRSRSGSRDRHKRSRSHSRERTGRPVELASTISSSSGSGYGYKEKPMTFKEQMRQQLLKASKILKNGESTEASTLEKPNNMAMSQSNILKAMAASVNSATASGVTPQMALLQTMAAMHQKAQELTGVTVPKYYNPAAVNPLKYAEQVQKRKLLWSKNKDSKDSKDETTTLTTTAGTTTAGTTTAAETMAAASHKGNEWQKTSFASDQDGKMAAKFRKLMGMKEGESDEGTSAELSEEQQRKQQELFSRLDKEYEFARMTTHTHRGVGLGFASQLNPNPGGP